MNRKWKRIRQKKEEKGGSMDQVIREAKRLTTITNRRFREEDGVDGIGREKEV